MRIFLKKKSFLGGFGPPKRGQGVKLGSQDPQKVIFQVILSLYIKFRKNRRRRFHGSPNAVICVQNESQPHHNFLIRRHIQEKKSG